VLEWAEGDLHLRFMLRTLHDSDFAFTGPFHNFYGRFLAGFTRIHLIFASNSALRTPHSKNGFMGSFFQKSPPKVGSNFIIITLFITSCV